MKQSLRLILLAGLLLSLLLAGCAAQRATSSDATNGRQAEMAPAMPVPAAEAPAADSAMGMSGAGTAYQADRKIIRTADLQLVVSETDKTVNAIKGVVAEAGGYVGSSNVWHEDNLLRAQLTLRVPADQMEAVLAQIRSMAVRVEREETGGQDVTEEYVDLQAQLTNLEAAETELRALLTDVREKSGKAEDIMAVYNQLVNIRGQIEQVKGRMQYLDRAVDMATINLQLSERAAEPIGTPGWAPLQTLRRALNALVQLGKLAVDAAIWIVVLGGAVIGIPALVVWLVWRLTRRRRELRAKQRAAEEELKSTGA